MIVAPLAPPVNAKPLVLKCASTVKPLGPIALVKSTLEARVVKVAVPLLAVTLEAAQSAVTATEIEALALTTKSSPPFPKSVIVLCVPLITNYQLSEKSKLQEQSNFIV